MQNQPFFPLFLQSYFIALGVLIGGAIIGGMAAFLTGKPPLTEIYRISNMIKIWAIVTAIGGTFDTVYTFERGFLDGQLCFARAAALRLQLHLDPGCGFEI